MKFTKVTKNETKTAETKTPRVYVACLASYNAGKAHGTWIDVSDPETMQAEIDHILQTSCEESAEEWAIHDYEGLPGSLGEHPDLETLCKAGNALKEHGKAFRVALDYQSGRVEDAIRMMESYRGCYVSIEAYAEEYINDCYDLKKMMGDLAQYFDYEKFARDLSVGGDVIAIENGYHAVFIFDGNY